MTVDETLKERGGTHGDFKTASFYWDVAFSLMMKSPNWSLLDAHQRRSLLIINDKITRILYGDSKHKDHWHDIQGYAKLSEREL